MDIANTAHGASLESRLDFSIGHVPLRLHLADKSLECAAAARYSAFMRQQAEPFSIFVRDQPQQATSAQEFSYEFEGAKLSAQARESRFAGVRNEFALDSLLRIFLSWKLLSYEGFLLHAATIVRGEKAHVFAGRSGAGKSTAAAMSPEGTVLTDEISLLRSENGVWRAYGTPFWGEFKAAGTDASAPIAGVYGLVQAGKHQVTRLSKSEFLRVLLQNVLFFTADPAAHQRLLEIVSRAIAKVPGYNLAFRKDSAFWEVLPA